MQTMTVETFAANSPEPASALPMRRIAVALRRRIGGAAIDARTNYLSEAFDHTDLQQRERAWDAHEERSAIFARIA